MRIQRSQQFREEYERLPEAIQKQATKQLGLFLQNPRHPSLQTKKMGGREVWEGRITRSCRFTFEIIGDVYRLRRIGPHDILRNP